MTARINDHHGNSATHTDWSKYFRGGCHTCEGVIPDYETMWISRDYNNNIDPIINVWSDFDTWYCDTLDDILRRLRGDIKYTFCSEKCAIEYWESIHEKCQTCGEIIISPTIVIHGNDDDIDDIWFCSTECLTKKKIS